ncbi:MAG TPA: hypothetical protein VLF67_02370 [Candidatus Saccharimonas sp.]|nr:hypothetical protein [Candidatus Saccharimonas sp.]
MPAEQMGHGTAVPSENWDDALQQLVNEQADATTRENKAFEDLDAQVQVIVKELRAKDQTSALTTPGQPDEGGPAETGGERTKAVWVDEPGQERRAKYSFVSYEVGKLEGTGMVMVDSETPNHESLSERYTIGIRGEDGGWRVRHETANLSTGQSSEVWLSGEQMEALVGRLHGVWQEIRRGDYQVDGETGEYVTV